MSKIVAVVFSNSSSFRPFEDKIRLIWASFKVDSANAAFTASVEYFDKLSTKSFPRISFSNAVPIIAEFSVKTSLICSITDKDSPTVFNCVMNKNMIL